jgi:hypothetical protein
VDKTVEDLREMIKIKQENGFARIDGFDNLDLWKVSFQVPGESL